MHTFKHTPGFTLIEVMIVVAVIGILAAIAYPSYQESVQKSRRSDAKAALLSLQQAQEKYRANCIQYADAIDDDTYGCAVGDYTLIGSTTSPNAYYNLTITNVTASTYTVTATHTGVQTADTKCKTLSIDQAGVKSSTDTSNAASTDCW